jgi:large conductance mechanosensitive channel
MGFVKEFKEFAMRGNVMDLAVGVVIGGAFGKIITAMVDSVIMPVIGMFTGDVDKFDSLTVGPVKVGLLIHAVLDFLIIAFALFLLVKAMNSMKKKEPEAAAPALTKSEELLIEIRDALKK